MGSPPLGQEAATSLPFVVEKWVLEQEVSFLVEEVIAAVGAAGLGREELARRLAAHPSVACIRQDFYTPRIVAMRAPFVVRVLADEREQRLLIPGHRFFPFCKLDGPPHNLQLVLPDGSAAGTEEALIPLRTVECASRLLPPGQGARAHGAGGLCTATAYDLRRFYGRGLLPPELTIRCLDYDAGEYSVEPHAITTGSDWEEVQKAHWKALKGILRAPPPGPVFAARQLLHVVASLFDVGWTHPVGPLGAILTSAPDVELDVFDGRTAFLTTASQTRAKAHPSRPKEPAPAREQPAPAPESPPSELVANLERHLKEVERRIRYPKNVRGVVSKLEWDPDRLLASGDVMSAGYWGVRAVVDLSRIQRELAVGCQCSPDPATGACLHVVLFLRELIRELRSSGSEYASRISADLSRPAWARALEKLERIARASSPPQAPTEVQRVVWRLKEQAGRLHVGPYAQKLQASGAWTRGRVIKPYELGAILEAWTTEADRRAAGTLEGRTRWGGYVRGDPFEVLACLVGHPHVYWEENIERPVRVEKAEMRLRFDVSEGGDLSPVLSGGGVDFDGGNSWYTAQDGFVLTDRAGSRVVLVKARGSLQELVALFAGTRPTFPPVVRDALASKLPALEAMLPVDLPTELAGEEVPADSRLRVRLAPVASSGLVASIRLRPLAGGPLVAPGEPPERVSDVVEGRRVCVKRRLADEAGRAKEVAAALGLTARPAVAPMSWVIDSNDDALDLVASLQDEKWKDLVIEWDDAARKMLLSREATPKDLRVAVQDAQDWFGIDGELEIDGTVVPLAQVIQALREGRRYIPVTGGVWVRISKLFQERLREMGDLLQLDHGKLRIGPEAAPLLRETVREIGLTKACRAWDAFLDRFDRAMKIEPKPPKGFKAEFRPYQLEGYRWLSRLAAWGVGGILADDMGLGKTVQALALLIDRAKEGPALVVAPTSVSSNWIAEAGRFAPKLRPVLYRETDRAAEPDEIKNGDLVVVSYAMAMRDVERLAKVKWGTLILDEAQFVKNSQTKTAQAIRQIAAGWRVALTGTPIENHLGDLWSLFRAISPGLFGSWERFRERFAAPIERDHDPRRREALARLVRPFVLRRTKDQVLQDLPARTEIRLDAELSTEERKLYDQARFAALAKLASKEADEDQRFQVLAALTRLRQLACHPRLVLPETKAGSAKLELFLETVDELRDEGHRALVFSQFTSLLALVREALDARGVKYQYLDGSTPAAKRDMAIQAFQRGEGDLFLISLKAGGTGLNLTAADYVIHLDPWWNPAVEDQATNRAHRIGQTRPVTVYRIVATGTIEEKILSLHASKRDLVEGVLDGADQAGKLSTDELIALIREG